MTIYQLRPDADRFQWLTMVDERDFDVEALFQGETIRSTWTPKHVIPLVEKGMPTAPLSDYPVLGTIPTFSRRAVDALRSILESNGELLPLASDVGEFYAFNVTNVIDALDEEQSKLIRFQSSGRVMSITQYAFRREALNDQMIFKLPQSLKGRPFVTQTFADVAKLAGLAGLLFDRL